MKTICFTCGTPLLLLLAGCATMVSDTVQVMHVTSNPPDAMVTADGIDRGVTPTQFALSRDRDHVVAIDMPGYKHCEIPIKRTVNRWFFGNLVIGGWVGMLVDGIDGAIYSLDPNRINAALQPVGTKRRDGHSTTPDSIIVPLTSHQKAGWTKIGQLERS